MSKTTSSSSLFWSLCLISLGQGSYNPSLQAFGADQLEPEEFLPTSGGAELIPNKKSLFFQWWYFGICSGSLLGVTIMSYIQDTFGWGLGFAGPMFAMATSIAFLSCGSRIYTYCDQAKGDEDGKPFESMVHTLKETLSKLINGGFTLSKSKSIAIELE